MATVNNGQETLTKDEKDNIKVDFLVHYVDDFPIYLIDFEGSGKNIYYRDAREAGTDMFNKDISKAAKDSKRIARNCLAPALGFDVNDSSDISGRITGYGYYWDVTFPEDLPEEIKNTYVSHKRRFDPNFSIELDEVLQDASYADAFSTFVANNFDSYSDAIVEGNTIAMPIKTRQIWAKSKDYKMDPVYKSKGNSQLIDEFQYFVLQEALSKLDFKRAKYHQNYIHDGHIEDGNPDTWKAVRYAKALDELKVKLEPVDPNVYPSLMAASNAADAKYNPNEKVELRADDVGGIYRREHDDDPEFIKLNKYSPTRESNNSMVKDFLKRIE